MADFHFKIEKVLRNAGAMAERMAVLRPFGDKVRMVTDAEVEAGALRVLQLWRRRCNVLRKEKWGPATTLAFQYMRNCPMVAVRARPDRPSGIARPCHHAGVCPWCWGREVVKRTYDLVSAVMERTESTVSTNPEGEYPYRLAVGVVNGRMAPGDPETVLNTVAQSMSRTKRRALKSAAGVIGLGVVQPGKKSWLYSTRLLVLVPAGTDVPKPMKVVEHPTRRKVAMAVARFARYPVGMMYADPGRTVALLDLRKKFRMFRVAGVFHASRAEGAVPPADPDTRFLDL